jgi:hypothetical protein
MDVHYELTEEDLIAFNIDHVLHSPSLRRRRLISRLIIPVLYWAIGLGFVFDRDFIWLRPVGLVLIVAGTAWFFGYDRLHLRRARKVVSAMLAEGSNASMTGQQTIRIEEGGVATETQGGLTTYRGSFITRVVRGARHLYLYTSSIVAIIVPLTAFPSPTDQDAFMEALKPFIHPEEPPVAR